LKKLHDALRGLV